MICIDFHGSNQGLAKEGSEWFFSRREGGSVGGWSSVWISPGLDGARLGVVSSERFIVAGCARIDDLHALLARQELPFNIKGSGGRRDLDCILMGIESIGVRFIERLAGDFAVVVLDRLNGTIRGFRDKMGRYQMYWRLDSGILRFALNPCELIESDSLSARGMIDYLLAGDPEYLRTTDTIWSAIKRLPPASVVTFGAHEQQVREYWSVGELDCLLTKGTLEEMESHFYRSLKQAVVDRVRSESIAILLSGGLDSSIIAAVVAELRDEGHVSEKISSVTVTNERTGLSNEGPIARSVASVFGFEHHEIDGDAFIRDEWFVDRPVPGTAFPTDAPTPDLSLTVARLAGSLGGVVLDGGAGDNLLNGGRDYSWLRIIRELQFRDVYTGASRLWRYHQFRPSLGTGIRRRFARILGRSKSDTPLSFVSVPRWLRKEPARRFLEERDLSAIDRFRERAQRKRLPNSVEMLSAPWGGSVSCFGEAREYTSLDPFLDFRVIRSALGLPLLPSLYKKDVLRHVARRKGLYEVYGRKKEPFRLPTVVGADQVRMLIGQSKHLNLIEDLIDLDMIEGGAGWMEIRIMLLLRWLSSVESIAKNVKW
jgi:asparagine synthase (glutamine-hydrolysing)